MRLPIVMAMKQLLENLRTVSISAPSFLSGFATLFDLGATRAPRMRWSVDPVEADRLAVESDWRAVDRDLGLAHSTLSRKQEASTPAKPG